MSVEHNQSAFPDDKVFYSRWKTKHVMAEKVAGFCKSRADFADVLAICLAVPLKSSTPTDGSDGQQVIGEVYLARFGRYYKIGKTNDTVRRGHEIRIQLPERRDMIHSIRTDDPVGVEQYWHKRVESKRMGGEWFSLDAGDVRAFRRWKRIA
jgi:hypothetical protein